jgi:RNA polymerase sigma-70 factor (ECF subfamily)
MSPPRQHSDSIPGGGRPFATTHWSIVLAAGHASRADSRAALAKLCETYWYPLYCFIRRRGHDAHEAEDLTQGFFAALLERDSLRVADPNRGRFRSFLLASLNHFLANEWRRQAAQKRGGGQPLLSLDCASGEARYSQEPAHDLTPEKLYERRWALTLLEQALSKLRQEYAAGGKSALFERLGAFLAGDEGAPYRSVAAELNMTEGAVKVAAHRLRRRCREHLRAEVAQTVADPQDVDEELRNLMAAMGP